MAAGRNDRTSQEPHQHDETFKRHGPEPPENDSGPTPSVEEMRNAPETATIHNVDPDEQVD